MTRFSAFCAALVLLLLVPGVPSSLQSDSRPSHQAPGYPSRSPDLDVLPGFKQPPPGYGEVAFYWWMGDTLTRERITWQMDQLAGRGVEGLQINYAHHDSGGKSWGLTYPSQPRLLSEEWWDLFKWFLSEAKKRKMSISLSDYTLVTPGQGWFVDEMLHENPQICGSKLHCDQYQCAAPSEFFRDVPDSMVAAMVFREDAGKIVPGSGINLVPSVRGKKMRWKPAEGQWKVLVIRSVPVYPSIDPMHPLTGRSYVEKFFQRFENECPGEAGKGLNFFFSDELDFGIGGHLWNDFFAAEFKKRKGYDVVPELPALFADIGPRTPKVRLDYNDVLVSLSEENFFKPVYDWHTDRGMLFGCDHGGRGLNVVEFGDYFRTQKWMPAPGCDQPVLERHIVKNKVASSISHLYERPRTWLEGFHSSNWGTSSAQVAEATFANYAMGQNLLTLHGLYYSTHGGWWEWAPPDNHFRQPYWDHFDEFLRCSERLSYMLSQGVHCCDVAILYPVAAMEAGIRGKQAVETAFAAGNEFYSAGIDFDYMDFESLARAEVKGKELHVAGERYKVLILPAMGAVRHSTMQKALEFYRKGGIVLAIGVLPEASDRVGRGDPELEKMVREIFGTTASEFIRVSEVKTRNPKGVGTALLVNTASEAVAAVAKAFTQDFVPTPLKSTPYFMHRKVGPRDVYFVFGIPKGTDCFFRCKGKVELWNPWNGSTADLPVRSVDKNGTYIRLPLSEYEPQLIVFSDGVATLEKSPVRLRIVRDTIALGGEWEFELKPTLDNCWGDYEQPPFEGYVGPKALTLRFSEELAPNPGWQHPGLVDSSWQKVLPSYGPQFWRLGPCSGDMDSVAMESAFVPLTGVDPSVPIVAGGRSLRWEPYEFSWRWGLKNNPGYQGYHGLKELVHDNIIQLGVLRYVEPRPWMDPEKEGNRYYLWSTVVADEDCEARVIRGGIGPSAAWVNHARIAPGDSIVKLKRGSNPVLLRYSQPGMGFFVFQKKEGDLVRRARYPLSTTWYRDSSILKYDLLPQQKKSAGWYRFTAPPGLRSMRFAARGNPRVWVDGSEVAMQLQRAEQTRTGGSALSRWVAELPEKKERVSTVAVRIDHVPGCYGGAALEEPVQFTCETGRISAGDLSQMEGLATYSGGMWYRKDLNLSASQASSREVWLDLGDLVSSAELLVNGHSVGVRPGRPWHYDITGKVRSGRNRVEVLVYNTLSNHFHATPSMYVGEITSGLLGPVVLSIAK